MTTLLRNVQLLGRETPTDLRIAQSRIDAIGDALPTGDADNVIDGAGGLLLPGLHDHHIHLVSLAASLESLRCGPPEVATEAALAASLRARNTETGEWLRGIGYHASVAGDIDRDWLDRHIPDRPARIQHRGGRLWVLNSRALATLAIPLDEAPPGLELVRGRYTGRLYESDRWLRGQLQGQFPDLGAASAVLASHGVTGITDTTPHNGAGEWAYFRAAQAQGKLLQRVRMMGSEEIADCQPDALLSRGEFKVHLLESQLPDLGRLSADIAAAHAAGRSVAVHCVTLTELVFALGAIEAAGVRPGDRIEHASVAPPDMLQQIRAAGLRVVTQPHFIAERGDQYRAEVDSVDQLWLYRCAGFLRAGVPLAAGSDAPFGGADPWAGMRAAVSRRTRSGVVMGEDELLTPEQALALYLSPADAPGVGLGEMKPGAPADLCLLRLPWEQVRERLDAADVRMTWRDGQLIYAAG